MALPSDTKPVTGRLVDPVQCLGGEIASALVFCVSRDPRSVPLFINKSKSELVEIVLQDPKFLIPPSLRKCLGGRGIVGRLGHQRGRDGCRREGGAPQQEEETGSQGLVGGRANEMRALFTASSMPVPLKRWESHPSRGHPSVTTGPFKERGQWNSRSRVHLVFWPLAKRMSPVIWLLQGGSQEGPGRGGETGQGL